MLWSFISKLLYRSKVKPFLKDLEDPTRTQDRRLNELLKYAANTAYGKAHKFRDIHSYRAFIEQVPVNQYAHLQPFIEQELAGNSNVLYPDPIDVVLATSGTTGEPKLIPYTRYCLQSSNRLRLRLFALADHLCPFLHGKLLAVVAPAVYKRIGNWEVGYLSGWGMKTGNRILRRKVVPKSAVFDITDWEIKFRETIRQAVETPKITACFGITSFIVAALRRSKYESFSWLVEDPQLSQKARKRVQTALDSDGNLNLSTLWPNLSVIFHGGVVLDLYEPVIQDLVPGVFIYEVYAGTECLYGIQLESEMRGVVPMIDAVFFEFTEAMEGPLPPDVKTIPLADVKVNTPYRILVSTYSGLWRYDVHDLVTFTALDPPVLRCLGKSENFLNLSGEKVSESDISIALTVACEKQDALLREFVVAPETSVSGAAYHIFAEFTKPPRNLEQFSVTVDETLKGQSFLYQDVRTAGTLSNVVIHTIPQGSFDAFERHRLLMNHYVIGQTKMPRITSYNQAVKQLLNVPLLTSA